ncbi:MAG: glycerol-3-phosphate 1-O-acyltransferase PlsY [Ruminococcaceae bacterium]|nr:glycerol-3-phosphate 1-O-acyltransferase PlsY [Oscillospiraceae bacterium]
MTFTDLRIFGILGSPYVKKIVENDVLEYSYTNLSEYVTRFIIVSVIMAIVGYLLGSLNFAIIISKVKYKDDIRKYGSGNAGMTNMMRTYGRAAGIVTFLGDILKAVVTVIIATLLMGEACGYIAGFACILGHCFPCWYKFKGGKGVAVTAAMILTLEPFVFLTVLIVFIACVAFTRYISLGSMMGALIYPIMLKNFYTFTHPNYHILYFVVMIVSILTALMILFLHRENMKRLLAGKENKFSFKKKGTNNQTTHTKSEEKKSLHHDDETDN